MRPIVAALTFLSSVAAYVVLEALHIHCGEGGLVVAGLIATYVIASEYEDDHAR